MYEKYVAIRDERGMTDYEVSKISGVSRSTFADWKSGRSEPKLRKLLLVAKALDVPITELIADEAVSE